MLSESAARWLLVLHTALSVATVAALTHLVIWMRGYTRGVTSRHRAVRKFAFIALALFGANFIVGNLVYPTYRMRVRAEYLDVPTAVVEDARRRAEEHANALERHGADPRVVAAARAAEDANARAIGAAKAGRWFDVKEHWVALGLALTAGLTLILAIWSPARDGSGIAPLTFVMALGAAGSVWLAAVIGVITAAWRAV